jgi:hypothetical protein
LQDFAALDPAWLLLAGRSESGGIRRVYLERPRGHSKTTDMAVQVAWILQYATQAVRGLAAATDREQGQLLHTAVAQLSRRNPHLCPDLVAVQNIVKHRRTGSELRIISSDVNSSWGQLPDFVICDELCHWPRPDLWYSLCSSAAKTPHCALVVLTNAGVGQGWTWQVREVARTSADWYFHTLDGPQAPWITPQALQEQQRLLPPAVYARLWENRWQQTAGEFVSRAEAAACCDPSLTCQLRGQPGRQYYAAIDYAEKHDRTVGVVVHPAGERIIVDRMDVAVPSPDQPIPVSWVEEWIGDMAQRFTPVRFVVDEYQLLSVLQRSKGRYDLHRFDFAGSRGHHALALLLRQLILERRVVWYPGCGAVSSEPRDDLETELANLVVRQVQGTRVRIDHRREPGCHDDRAFALGAACLEVCRQHSPDDWWTITPPTAEGLFAW